tara:strand:- start:128427 stop:129977 length:1551 start_codon:yes stop_codon:yes gene_type:complete
MQKLHTSLSRRSFLGTLAATFAVSDSKTLSADNSRPVRIRLRSDPFPFDPANHVTPENEIVCRAVYAPLTRMSGNGWVPFLAKEIVEDHDFSGKTPKWRIRISLPAGAVWSGPDARDIEPRDITDTITRLRDAGLPAWQDVVDAEFIDAHNLHLVLARKDVSLWRTAFPRTVGSITKRGREISIENTRQGEASGPYYLEQHWPNDRLMLSRRDEWNGAAPGIKRAEFLIIPHTETALVLFRNGELDIINVTSATVGSQRQERFDEFGDSFVEVRDSSRVIYVGMDTNNGATGDENVRRAVMAAIDQDAVVKETFGEIAAIAAYGVIPRQFIGGIEKRTSEEQAAGNPNRAMAILQEAGHERVDTEIFVPSWLGSLGLNIAEVISEQLKPAGIQASPRLIEAGNWISEGMEQRGIFLDWTSDSFDAATALAGFYSKSQYNPSGFEHPEYDALYEQALVVGDEDRSGLYSSMQKILTDNAVVVPIAQQKEVWLVRDGLSPSFAPNGQLGDLLDFQVLR